MVCLAPRITRPKLINLIKRKARNEAREDLQR